MSDKNIFRDLGDYARNLMDKNKDGRVSVGEFFSTLLPNNAVKLALVAVDVLAIVGEYRVWQVGMHVTNGNPYAAAGFVAVSAVPFLLGQILWMYPLATGWQRAIAVIMVSVSLFTSMQFGFADLSQSYDVIWISKAVTRLWLFYIILFLLYVLGDEAFQLARAAASAKAQAKHQVTANDIARGVLTSLRGSLEELQNLEAEFGRDAVEAGLAMMGIGRHEGKKTAALPGQKQPALPAPSQNQNKPSNNQHSQHPWWEADQLLSELKLNRDQAYKMLGANPDEFYKNLKPHGIEQVDISRKNVSKIYGQLRANGRVPANANP